MDCLENFNLIKSYRQKRSNIMVKTVSFVEKAKKAQKVPAKFKAYIFRRLIL